MATAAIVCSTFNHKAWNRKTEFFTCQWNGLSVQCCLSGRKVSYHTCQCSVVCREESHLPYLHQLQLWCCEATGPNANAETCEREPSQQHRFMAEERPLKTKCQETLHTHFAIDLHRGANIASERADSYFRVSLSWHCRKLEVTEIKRWGCTE